MAEHSKAEHSKLVSLYIRSCLIGFAVAGGFVALLAGFDVAGIGHLVAASPDGLLALVMLWIFNGIVFAGVQFGIAIMSLATPDEEDGGHPAPRKPRAEVLVPVPVEARTGNR